MVLFAVFFTFVTIFWIHFLWSRRKLYAFGLKMPGQFGLPLIGIFHKLFKLEELLYNLPKLAVEYKTKTFFSWIGPVPLLYTADPKIAEIILNSTGCINKSFFYNVVHDLIGVGLLTSKSETWQVHRKLINPSFSHQLLLNFFPKFNQLSREICEKFDEAVGCGEINVKELTFAFALKSALATTMGYDYSTNTSSVSMGDFKIAEFVAASRIMKPWLNISFIMKRKDIYKKFEKSRDNIKAFIQDLALQKLKAFEEEDRLSSSPESNIVKETVDIKREKHIFIDRAIKIHQRNEFTVDDIVTESNIIVIAATDTAATGLYALFVYLAMFPQYQEKVFEEIDALFPDEMFDVAYEDFKNLTYLDMCVNESLRNSPGIPLIARDCTEDVPISEDLAIPKGTQVIIDIFNMHRDKDIWGPTADTFDPDHFLPTEVAKRNGYAFLPFSKGPRNCLGWLYGRMVLRVAAAQILRKYRFTTKFQFKDIIYLENITLNYKTLPYLEVHRRK